MKRYLKAYFTVLGFIAGLAGVVLLLGGVVVWLSDTFGKNVAAIVIILVWVLFCAACIAPLLYHEGA